MSFLNSVLGSIGTGNRTALPKPPDRASTATPPASKTISEINRPSSSNAQKSSPQVSQVPSLKRKLEVDESQRNGNERPPAKTNVPPDRPKIVGSQLFTASFKAQAQSKPTPPATSSRPPPKGSYMDLMNQAKALQAEKAAAGQQVGLIKHAASKKELLSKSERRKMEEESRSGKGKGKAPKAGDVVGIKKSSQQIHAKGDSHGSSVYKHAARTSSSLPSSKDKQSRSKDRPEIAYKGTAGMGKQSSPSRKSGGERRSRRTDDEYDSEDSFIVDDEEESGRGPQMIGRNAARYRYVDDDESDASSDMEAGYDDVEQEERRAALQAKKDDERERAIEERLKQAKEAKRRAFAQGR